MRKGYLIPPVIVILALIMFFVALVLYLNSDLIKKAKNNPTPTSTTQSSPIASLNPDAGREPNGSAQTANWKTYTNAKYKYSFKYPLDFELQPLSQGDNQFTPWLETGKEGTFVRSENKSMVVNIIYTDESNKNLSFEEFVNTQGTYINPCHEARPAKTEPIATNNDIKGIKAWYPLKQGCQGAGAGELNDPYAFFDSRKVNDGTVSFFENKIEKFDQILSTFQFLN